MKSDKKILLAFILNLSFSVFEFIGGIFTNSVAILSDSVHDLGDAASIGISYFLEKKAKKKPDQNYTYGYAGYSVIGGVITTLILLLGSCFVIYNAIKRIINPSPINYNGMIIFAVIGVAVNFLAAYITREGHSINQKAVNLHMLEDVLGWVVVLLGAIIMRFTDISIIDPLMSIGVAVFILIDTLKNLKEVVEIFCNKIPSNISISEIKEHISEIEGVTDVHHIHIWSIDGQTVMATMHIVTNSDPHEIKHKVREELEEHGISHSTLELECESEHCHQKECKIEFGETHHHHHHHHH